MKKISILSGLAFCLGLVACDNYDLPNPPAQSNPEQEVFASTDLVLSQAAPEVNLVELNNQEAKAIVANIDKLDNFPTPYELKFEVQVAANDAFEKYASIDGDVADNTVTVSPDALNGAIRQAITKDPATTDVTVRLIAFAEYGNSKVRLGETEDTNYGVFTYQVKPFEPNRVIEDTYYLVGNFCDWDVTKGLAFTHTTEGSVYDNAVFSVKINVDADQAAAGYEWKVVPASSVNVTPATWDGAYGVVAAEDGLSGRLIESPEAKSDAATITAPNPYLITIDMESLTYEVSLAIENLWVPTAGTSASNWSKILMLSTENYINYRGVSPLRGNFWFTPAANFNTEYYQNPDLPSEAVATENGELQQAGGIILRDSQNKQHTRITLDRDVLGTANALYWIDVNLVQMNYTITQISNLGVVGAFNGWNAAESVKLTPSKDLLTWTGTVTLDGGEFKFNANGQWNVDFGGIDAGMGAPSAQICYKGANLTAEAGTYDITIKFSAIPYTVELVKK